MSAKPITIRNCGTAAGETPVVHFRFRCPRTWESLDAGPNANTRHCSDCQRFVYFCRSPDEAADRAVHGDCIAVKATLVERDWQGLWSDSVGLIEPPILGQPLPDYEPRPDPRPPGNRLPPTDL